MADGTAPRPRTWPRLLLCGLAQLPAGGLLVFGQGRWAPLLAGFWGAACCILATDSIWRWRNRLLVLAAAAWLVLASLWPQV